MTSDDGYWWVQPKGLHQAPLEVLHLKRVLECGRAVGVTEDLVEFLHNFVLDVLVDAHHGEEETAASGCSVVTLRTECCHSYRDLSVIDPRRATL